MPAMFRIATAGSSAWAGSSLQIDDLTNPAETWSYSTELGLARASGYDFADSFVTWANAGARAWSGVVSFSWAATPRLSTATNWQNGLVVGIDLTATAAVSWTFSSGLTAMTGISSGVATSSVSTGSSVGVQGSVAGEWWVRGATHNANRADGVVSGSGGWLEHSTATSPARPSVEAGLTEGQVFALATAQSRIPSGRRQVHVYQESSDTWVLVSWGKTRVRRRGASLYHAEPRVLAG